MADLLTQKELAKNLAEKTGLSEETAKNFIEYFFDSIKSELKNSDSVAIFEFGTFKKKWVEESDGINPATLEKIKIPAHYKIIFRPSANIVRLFNQKYADLKPILVEKREEKSAENLVPPQNQIPEEDDEDDEDENEEISENQTAENKENIIEEKSSEKKSGAGKIIAIIIAALVILIILIILLAKGCSSKSEQTQIAQSEPKTTQNAPKPKSDENQEKAEAQAKPEKSAPVNPAVTKKSSEFTFKNYSVPSGSNYHKIAEEEYKNRHLWPVVYNANKDSSPNPDVVESGATIKVPEITSLSADAENIKAAMLEAFNAYKKQISSANSESENAEKKRLAAGVLASAENLYPGFINANKDKIGAEYADYAKGIFKRNF